MTAFENALNQLFTDSNLSVIATYAPAAGGSSSIRVVRRAPPSLITGGGMYSDAVLPAYLIDVRVSDVAQPAEGDTITIGSDTFEVKSFEYDSEKLAWELNVDKQ